MNDITIANYKALAEAIITIAFQDYQMAIRAINGIMIRGDHKGVKESLNAFKKPCPSDSKAAGELVKREIDEFLKSEQFNTYSAHLDIPKEFHSIFALLNREAINGYIEEQIKITKKETFMNKTVKKLKQIAMTGDVYLDVLDNYAAADQIIILTTCIDTMKNGINEIVEEIVIRKNPLR